MTLTLNITMGGALTGAAFNQARALGPMVGAVSAAFVHSGMTRFAGERMIAQLAATPAE
jgi:glycerol uptake facilitator-like aquaporin